MTTKQQAKEIFENGILMGWVCETWVSPTKRAKVFIPRRDEDIEADQRAARS